MSKKPFFFVNKRGGDVFFLQFFQTKRVRFMPIYDNIVVHNADIRPENSQQFRASREQFYEVISRNFEKISKGKSKDFSFSNRYSRFARKIPPEKTKNNGSSPPPAGLREQNIFQKNVLRRLCMIQKTKCK